MGLLLLALLVLLRVVLRRLLAGERRRREEQTAPLGGSAIGAAGGSEPAGCSCTVLYNARKPTVEAVKRLMVEARTVCCCCCCGCVKLLLDGAFSSSTMSFCGTKWKVWLCLAFRPSCGWHRFPTPRLLPELWLPVGFNRCCCCLCSCDWAVSLQPFVR